MTTQLPKEINCSVNGMIRRGAMCAHIKVGCKFCGLKMGECNLQVESEIGSATPVLQKLESGKS